MRSDGARAPRPEARRRRRPALPAPAARADLPLRLHHRGDELHLPAARPHARTGSPSPGTAPDIWAGARRSRSASPRSPRSSRWSSARSAPRRWSRARFFGREAISLLLILPIALPGIITGISLRSAFALVDIPFSFWTIVLGHATFCIVVVYNNAVARFRRTLRLADRGLDRPRRRRLPDLPLRDPAEPRHRAARRRHARLRALLRRGDRHHLHRRPADDAADLDARGAGPPAPAPGHQRRRHLRHRSSPSCRSSPPTT